MIEQLLRQVRNMMFTQQFIIREHKIGPLIPRLTVNPDPIINARFHAGEGRFEEISVQREILVGYDDPVISVSKRIYDSLNADNNLDHYTKSIIVHELTHFLQFEEWINGSQSPPYISQSGNNPAYFEQQKEFEAYAIQSAFYYNLNVRNSASELKALCNRLFSEYNLTTFRYSV